MSEKQCPKRARREGAVRPLLLQHSIKCGYYIHGSLLTLFTVLSVRTVNYGPSFFPSIYGPNVKRAGYKLMEKTKYLLYYLLFGGLTTSEGQAI